MEWTAYSFFTVVDGIRLDRTSRANKHCQLEPKLLVLCSSRKYCNTKARDGSLT